MRRKNRVLFSYTNGCPGVAGFLKFRLQKYTYNHLRNTFIPCFTLSRQRFASRDTCMKFILN